MKIYQILSLSVFMLASSLHAAIFTVTNTADSGGGSLRDAINNVNLSVDPTNTINFNITGPGPFTISPATDLPAIVKNVTIDGYSQPGSSQNTDPIASNAVLTIVLNGSNYTVGLGQFATSGYGLHFAGQSTGSTVTGLNINQWIGAGIYLDGSAGGANVNNCTIIGNFIGTDSTGTVQQANQAGILINTVNGTLVGNATVIGRNVIAGSFAPVNGGAGITVFAGNNTTIQGNLIGLDKTGTTTLGFSSLGVSVSCVINSFSFPGAAGTIIGGTTTLERNIISGHSVAGILFGPSSTNSIVQGNFVGTDVTGTVVLGNDNQGISIYGLFLGILGTSSTNNLIGGSTPEAANLVVGSGFKGIAMGDTNYIGATGNFIEGNRIGTNLAGTAVLGNNGWGIVVVDSDNTIGGSSSGQANVISDNDTAGILLYGQSANGNVIQGNLIGTDITGTHPIGNNGPGIQIGLNGGLGGSSNNTIGA